MFQAIGDAYGFGEANARTAQEMIRDSEGDPSWNKSQNNRAKELHSALMAAAGGQGRTINPKWLGMQLNRDLNRRVDDLRLCSVYDSHAKVNRWYVEEAAEAENMGAGT